MNGFCSGVVNKLIVCAGGHNVARSQTPQLLFVQPLSKVVGLCEPVRPRASLVVAVIVHSLVVRMGGRESERVRE